MRKSISAGPMTVILPAETKQEVRLLPDHMQDKVSPGYVRDIQQALSATLVPPAM